MSKQATSIDYGDIDHVLRSAKAAAGAAEVHGLMTGLLVGRARNQGWIDQIFDEAPDPRDLSVRECVQSLEVLANSVVEQLNDPELGFEPLLPDDDQALGERTIALAGWVQGFLYGLGLGGAEPIRSRGGDAAEILRDLEQIARASLEGPATEADESAYAELVEYVRVGVMLVNEELNPIAAAPRLQ